MADVHGIDVVLNEIHIVSGINDAGRPVFGAMFKKAGTETDDGTHCDLIDYVEGLGLLEAAKHDFIQRHWNDDDA
jgi:hypothetical protein